MTSTRTARWVQRCSFAAAGLVAAWALAPVGAAQAANEAPPADAIYSGAATAIGVQAQVDTNPEPSNVPDLFDLQAPVANSTFDSTGQSDAVGHLADGHGATQIPGLICLASPDACTAINGGLSSIPGGIAQIPVPDPLVAHATYPAPTHAEAPNVGSTPVQTSFGTSQGSLTVGKAIADADPKGVSSSATSSNAQFPLIVSGDSSTTTSQSFVKGAFVTTATSSISDITIGELLQIKGVKVIASVSQVPGKAPVDTSSATATGISIVGMSNAAITIDQDGLHVAGLNPDQVKGLLLTVGITNITLVGTSNQTDDSGYAAQAAGLQISFDTNISGLPVPAIPVQVISACESVIGAGGLLGAVTSNLPVDACTGVGISPNAEYYGKVLLGQAGVTNFAQKDQSDDGSGDFNPPVDTTPTDTPSTAPSSAPATTPAVVPPADNGGGDALGTTGSIDPGTGTSGDVTPPIVSNGGGPTAGGQTLRQVSLPESLGDTHKRLLWLFPVMILAGLGILAGRFGKVPARIPRMQ